MVFLTLQVLRSKLQENYRNLTEKFNYKNHFKIMQKLKSVKGSTLGGRGLSKSIDSTIMNEFGLGRLSIQTAILSIGLFREHVCVYVTDSAILLILMANGEDAVNQMTRSFKNEEKYVIKFKNISDIKQVRGLQHVNKAFNDKEKELRRQGTKIYFHKRSKLQQDQNDYFNEDYCMIDTHETFHFYKTVLYTFQSYNVRKCSKMGTLHSLKQNSLAQEYYDETIICLNEATSETEIKDILDEFANETILDLELKNIVFRSRELFVLCFTIWNRMTILPRHTAPLVSFESNIDDLDFNGKASEAPLKKLIMKRLLTIRSILNLLCSVFFSSESIDIRSNITAGPLPLGLDSWVALSTNDPYSTICNAFGLKNELNDFDIVKELEKSLIISKQTKSICSSIDNSNKRISRFSVSEEILTPIREKLSRSVEALNNGGSMAELVLTCSSIKDLQLVLSNELWKITSLGFTLAGNTSSLSRLDFSNQSYYASFGESYIQESKWEESLEMLLLRMNTLLGDILSDNNTAYPSNHRHARSENDTLNQLNSHDDSFEWNQLIASTWSPPSYKNLSSKTSKSKINSSLSSSSSSSKFSFGDNGSSNYMKCQDNALKSDLPAVFRQYDNKSCLETREILLFYYSSFLRALAEESSKIRKCLIYELYNYFNTIMTIFNIIVPRPILVATVQDPTVSVAEASSKRNWLNRIVKKAGEKKSMNSNNGDNTSKTSLLLMQQYGPPKNSMSIHAWNLLVMSRCAFEDLVLTLDLNGIDFHNKEPLSKGAYSYGTEDNDLNEECLDETSYSASQRQRVLSASYNDDNDAGTNFNNFLKTPKKKPSLDINNTSLSGLVLSSPNSAIDSVVENVFPTNPIRR